MCPHGDPEASGKIMHVLHMAKNITDFAIYMYYCFRLRPNSRYVFRVAATNDKGTSPFSVQSDSVITLEDSKYKSHHCNLFLRL